MSATQNYLETIVNKLIFANNKFKIFFNNYKSINKRINFINKNFANIQQYLSQPKLIDHEFTIELCKNPFIKAIFNKTNNKCDFIFKFCNHQNALNKYLYSNKNNYLFYLKNISTICSAYKHKLNVSEWNESHKQAENICKKIWKFFKKNQFYIWIHLTKQNYLTIMLSQKMLIEYLLNNEFHVGCFNTVLLKNNFISKDKGQFYDEHKNIKSYKYVFLNNFGQETYSRTFINWCLNNLFFLNENKRIIIYSFVEFSKFDKNVYLQNNDWLKYKKTSNHLDNFIVQIKNIPFVSLI